MSLEGSQLTLDGYPEGTTFHGVDSLEAHKLKRLVVFRSYLEQVGGWLRLMPSDEELNGDAGHVASALADAALVAFCKCFDVGHKLKPLKAKKVFTPAQRDQLDRLKTIRNKLVAHDENPLNGLFTLVARSGDMRILETVSINLNVPFVFLPELQALRDLHKIALQWVADEHERVASIIVHGCNAMPLEERAAAPPFRIKTEINDVYGQTSQRVPKS
jgi:hypothetical protein